MFELAAELDHIWKLGNSRAPGCEILLHAHYGHPGREVLKIEEVAWTAATDRVSAASSTPGGEGGWWWWVWQGARLGSQRC